MTIPDQEEQEQIIQLLSLLDLAEAWFQQDPAPAEPGSALAGDDRETHPLDLSQAVDFAFGIAVDHLHAMKMSMTARGPGRIDLHTYADFTGARAAIENAARALWIVSPKSRDQRILRHLRLELASANAIGSFVAEGGLSGRDDVDRRCRCIFELADKRGLASEVKRKPSPSEYVKGAALHIDMLKDDGVNLLFLLWRMCSAIAHGDTWVISVFEREILEEIRPGIYMAQFTAPTAILYVAVTAAVALLGKARELSDQRGTCQL